MDRDHYFDWLSSSLENCSLTKLPVWLLNVQIYWDELLQYRRHGRRIASAILSHLHAVCDAILHYSAVVNKLA